MADTHPSRKYRAAIIGCGRIASSIEDEMRPLPGLQPLPYSHAGAYDAARGVGLVAAADPDADRLNTFGRRWEIGSLFGDTEQMLDAVRPHIVSICTPTRTHADLALMAIAYGVRGVLLEKPVSVTLEQADRISAAAAGAGAIVAVNHTRTYDPIHGRARQLIEDGFIGTVDTVFACWAEGWSFGGSHLFDILRFLLADDPTTVRSLDHEDGKDPGGDAYLRYDTGAHVFVRAPRQPKMPIDLELLGTDGRLRIGTFSLQLFRNDTSLGVPVPTEWPFFARIEMRSAMTTLVEETIAAIEGRARVRSGVPEGRKALEIAIALHESARRQIPIPLPLDDPSLGIETT